MDIFRFWNASAIWLTDQSFGQQFASCACYEPTQMNCGHVPSRCSPEMRSKKRFWAWSCNALGNPTGVGYLWFPPVFNFILPCSFPFISRLSVNLQAEEFDNSSGVIGWDSYLLITLERIFWDFLKRYFVFFSSFLKGWRRDILQNKPHSFQTPHFYSIVRKSELHMEIDAV